MLGIYPGKWGERENHKCLTRLLLEEEDEENFDPDDPIWKHQHEPNKDYRGLVLANLDSSGQMDIDNVDNIVNSAFAKGRRKFIIVATAGTTMLGAVDPIKELGLLIEKYERKGAKFYFHIDAAFGGLVAPFLLDEKRLFDFRVPQVDSMTVDPHKMGRVPYPAGIFLCKKMWQKNISRAVAYISSHKDDTILGSRPGASAAACWAMFNTWGKEGFTKVAENCMKNTVYLANNLKKLKGAELITEPTMNILGVRFDPSVYPRKNILDLAKKYRVVPELFAYKHDECPTRVFRFTIMPHVKQMVLDDFLKDLKAIQR